MKNILIIAACIAVCYAAAAIGTVPTTKNIPTWYAGLNKPPLNPPNWIFGPVWSLLYTAMAVAVALVIISGKQGWQAAALFFAAQLIFNTAWSLVFFGMKQPFAAIFVITALWILILTCIILFWKISKPASIMMMPYILWVSFASYLNVGIYWLNK